MTEWLTTDQQQTWRAYLAATTLLTEKLSRELQAAHGLTMADYEILVRLSEAPDRRLRMSHLAAHTLASRSRLSHQVDRLEKAGLVERQACEDDRRGANAVLTERGWTAPGRRGTRPRRGRTPALRGPAHRRPVRRPRAALSVVAAHLQGLEPDCESTPAAELVG